MYAISGYKVEQGNFIRVQSLRDHKIFMMQILF
jgi:hypothetical protein